MVFLSVVLLIVFLAGFFGLEQFAQNALNASDIRVIGISILSPEFRLFLGIGVIFCEFAIVFFSMLPRIGDTIKDALIPLARLLPMGAFLGAIYNTFEPIFRDLMPASLSATSSNGAYIAQAISTGSFGRNLILTLLTMILFAITTQALGNTTSNSEVQRLRAEVERYRKELRRVI